MPVTIPDQRFVIQAKFPFGLAARGRSAAISGVCAVIFSDRCGISGKLFNRSEGPAVTPAARDNLTGIERLRCRRLQPGHARQIDQPRPMHPRDAELCQPGFLGGQGSPDEVIDALCKAVIDVISGRTDPKNVGLVLRPLYGSGQPLPLALKIYAGIAYGCYQWLCIVAVLGFARRWLNRDGAARRYLTDAVFPYYIVHQTAIILMAHQLRGRGLPASIEAAIVVSGTLASAAAAYEIVRRVSVLRPLFGLKPGKPHAPSGLPRLECDHAASP
jgi:hypothetical protein